MGKTLKISPEGRKCKFPKCKRLLSVYNHAAYCRIHWDQVSRKKVLKIPCHRGSEARKGLFWGIQPVKNNTGEE